MSYIIKIGIIGDYNVGKTSILNKYLNINKLSEVTLGVDFKHIIKDYENIKFKLHIWDTSGQEKFKAIVSSYYRDLDVFLLMFDCTDLNSFNNIETWLNEIEVYNKKNVIKFLVSNKVDKNNMIITANMAKKLAHKYNMYFFQTTINNVTTINNLFDSLIETCYTKMINKEIKFKSYINYDNLKIQEHKQKKNKKKNNCCIIQ